MKPMTPLEPLTSLESTARWWPEDLGAPTSSGGQDGVRYAFFPEKRRLLVEQDGRVTAYDSGEHQISGVSQRSGPGSLPVFTSPSGPVELDALRRAECS
ncbi:MAG: hypothetical protein Q7T61_00610 [Caulobacter sp.]|nr:hypothetical protein [Caulobacter sp.]